MNWEFFKGKSKYVLIFKVRTMKILNKKAFTLVELIIVISILIILTTISIVSYDKTLTDARNSARITDMSNMKVSLKNHKLKNGSYPKPGNSFVFTNQWENMVYQWYLDDEVITQEIINKPKDPQYKNYYMYSITANKSKFQIAMSIEDDGIENDYMMRAYVDGDYQKVAMFMPSIVFATDTWGDVIADVSSMFIVDKWTLNWPYDSEWVFVNKATSFTWIESEVWVSIPTFYGYYSCTEISENGAFMWTWSYRILDSSGVIAPITCPVPLFP